MPRIRGDAARARCLHRSWTQAKGTDGGVCMLDTNVGGRPDGILEAGREWLTEGGTSPANRERKGREGTGDKTEEGFESQHAQRMEQRMHRVPAGLHSPHANTRNCASATGTPPPRRGIRDREHTRDASRSSCMYTRLIASIGTLGSRRNGSSMPLVNSSSSLNVPGEMGESGMS